MLDRISYVPTAALPGHHPAGGTYLLLPSNSNVPLFYLRLFAFICSSITFFRSTYVVSKNPLRLRAAITRLTVPCRRRRCRRRLPSGRSRVVGRLHAPGPCRRVRR